MATLLSVVPRMEFVRRIATGVALGAPVLLRSAELPDTARPAGVQAARILDLWYLTLAECGLVFAAILLVLTLAIWRGARRAGPPSTDEAAAHAGRSKRAVAGATAVCAVLLAGLLAADVWTDRVLSRMPTGDALHIEMIGHQWWWELRYRGADGRVVFAAANELHIPVGRPVVTSLASVDVIHSFWVPNLHGKKDLVPGRASRISLRADRPGVFRGQCAEFCGLEHALMAFSLTAAAPGDYAAWEAHQRAPAPAPATEDAKRGERIFQASNCAQCHSVRGTQAAGSLGPDLTHLGSRSTIAGTLPNRPGLLAAWILEPQSFKPGTSMPSSRLPPDDVRLLVSYLGTLQ